jgi:hypothetical protein
MQKTFTDWSRYEEKARGMTEDMLRYAIADCQECIRLRIDEEFYSDESSVYSRELTKRKRKARR